MRNNILRGIGFYFIKNFKFSLIVFPVSVLLMILSSCREDDVEYIIDNDNTAITKSNPVILDQPAGEIRYYQVRQKIAGNEEYREYITPVIFGANGDVYIRNIIGTPIKKGAGTWTKGYFNDERIEIPSNSPYGVYLYYYYRSLLKNSTLKSEDYVGEIFPAYIDSNGEGDSYITKDEEKDMIFLKMEGDGSISLINDNTAGEGISYTLFDTYMTNLESNVLITELTFIPIDLSPVTPPKSSSFEKWQIIFTPYNKLKDEYSDPAKEYNQAGLVLDCVISENNIYLRGLSTYYGIGDPLAWVKGEIQGNKVVFKNGQFLGIGNDGRPLYLKTVDSDKLNNEFIKLEIVDFDLVFDFNSEEGILNNANSAFCISSSPDSKWEPATVNYDRGTDSRIDLFKNVEIKRIPVDIEPIPRFAIHITYHSHGGYWDTATRISYLDINGNVLDTSKLEIRYVKKIVDKDTNFSRYETVESLPFNAECNKWDYINTFRSSVAEPLNGYDKVFLVYKDNGKEYFSNFQYEYYQDYEALYVDVDDIDLWLDILNYGRH